MTAHIAIVTKRPEVGQDPMVSSIRDLASQDRIQYGVIYGSLTYHFFRTSNDPTIKKMWRAMSAPNKAVYTWTSAAGLDKVRKSNKTRPYVFLMENRLAEYLVNRHPCDLMTVGDTVNPVHYALAVRKKSPLLPKLNKAIHTLHRRGVIHKLQNKWWKNECIHPYKITSGATWPLGMQSLPFFLFLIQFFVLYWL